jgi:hypothetical protein
MLLAVRGCGANFAACWCGDYECGGVAAAL